MKQAVLVLNVGSSSVKFAVYAIANGQIEAALFKGKIDALAEQLHLSLSEPQEIAGQEWHLPPKPPEESLQEWLLAGLLTWLAARFQQGAISAVGHRVVHGGETFTQPVVVEHAVLQQLEALNELAPLHQPYNLAGIKALLQRQPDLLQVACFDTAFHTTQPAVAQQFALPPDLAAVPLKRYGFHGLSYEYIIHAFPRYAGVERAAGRLIIAHLGHGASLCAVKNGQSIATTMGFTALDGLPMSTRCGNLDPGVVLYLLMQGGKGVEEVYQLLYYQAGLLGVSGLSADMRTLLQSDDPRAVNAIALFVYRVQREIGSLVAALGGVDELIFTAGIGEHAAEIRARICVDLDWLGVVLDNAANIRCANCINTAYSKVGVWVIPTDEERMIAQHTWRLFCAR